MSKIMEINEKSNKPNLSENIERILNMLWNYWIHHQYFDTN